LPPSPDRDPSSLSPDGRQPRPARGSDGGTLRRAVSRWEVVALAINSVIGSGIFLLPGTAAALLGVWSLPAVLLAAVAVLLIVLCFAEASSRFDQPGAAYLYARAAFGDLVGFEVGWMTWLARVATIATLTVGFARAIAYLIPAAGDGWVRLAAIAFPVVTLTAVNVIGVEAGARTGVVLTIGKLVPLAVFIGAGLFAASWSTAAAQTPTQDGGLAPAAILLLFAYAGFENAPAPAGEYRRPRRDVPFALMANLAIVTAVYVGVQWVALGTLPGLGSSTTPLADAAATFLGGWGGPLLTVGAAVSILGTVGSTTLAGPRYLYALALDGYGPRFLAAVHPRFRTPANAVLTQGAVALPLALSGSFEELAALSVIARLASYLGTAAAVPMLRRRADLPAAGFRLPGGPTIPILASLVTLGLAASAGARNLIAAAIALAVGAALYAVRRDPRGGSFR
jgi:basic amino acid/polyamine antiporter, APA family